MSIAWDQFWSRAYASPQVIDPAIARDIKKLFFPDQAYHVDVSPSSPLPYAKELAELFSTENPMRPHLSFDDVSTGFHALATSHIRMSPSNQKLGNAVFRKALCRIFAIGLADNDVPQAIARIVAGDSDFLKDGQKGWSEASVQDDVLSSGTPVGSSDEPQPLLRSKTTTSKTVSAFRGQGLLEWDDDTQALYQHIFSDIFDFVQPGASSFSVNELHAIASSGTPERSFAAKKLIERYQGFTNACSDDIVTRAYVKSILEVLSNDVCISDCEGFRVAFNAYIRRKIIKAEKVMSAMKVYQVGGKYLCRNPDRDAPDLYMRCEFVRRADKGAFVVSSKGKEFTVTDLQEPESDDEMMDEDPVKGINDIASSFVNNSNKRSTGTGDSDAVPYVDPWAHVDWSDEAYARDTPFVLRAIAADFPHFELGDKKPSSEWTPHKRSWPVSFFHRSGPNKGDTKYEVPFDAVDYGISFEPFCTREFLPSLSAEDHKRLMETAAMRESFRCFFLHLAVELGVHPVALQVTARDFIAAASPPLPPPPPPSPPFVCSTFAGSGAQCSRN